MNLYDIVSPMTVDEAKATKQRLDAKCWKGKHKEGTKVKGGVRVNNCVPNESVAEAIGYESNKAYSEVGPYKRYTVYVTKKKFNEKFGFVAVAVNPRTNDAKFKAAGPTQQDAVTKLQAEVDKEIDVATKVSGSATIDFNVDFVRDVLEMSSNTFYAKIIPGPKLVIAGKEMEQYPDIMKQEGFKTSSIRTVSDSEGATKLPAMPLSASGAATAQLIANGRYALGAETIDKDGNRIFDLEFDSVVADPRERIRMGAPAITIGTKRETTEDSWHAGDNAWSSENHEMVEGHSFSNGDQVELKPEYADRAGEVYTVSQCDRERGRCWIGDADGRGWYARFDQLVPSVGQEEFDEGWSDAVVAQRTGRPRTPYSVYIKGKKWKDFENDDHAEAVANKLRAKFKADGRDPSVITIAATDYDKGVEEGAGPQSKLDQKIVHLLTNGIPADAIARKLDIPVEWVHEVAEYNMPDSAIDYNDPRNTAPTNRFGEGVSDKTFKELQGLFKQAKAGKLKSNGVDFTKGDHWTGPDKDDPSYTRNFGHGYPDTPSNRSHDRYVNKSLKKDVDEADETSWTANSAQFRREEELSWPVEITLEPKDDINRGRGAQVKTMTVTGQSRDAAKKKLVDYFRKNGWAVTGIKFTGDLDEQGVAEMDKSQKGAPGWNIDDYDYSKGKWTQGKIMTAKDATAYARTELDKHFNNPEQLKKAVNKVNKKGVEESTNYWTRLQNQRNTKLNSLVDELKESVKK